MKLISNTKYSYNGKEIRPYMDIGPDIVPCISGITMKEFYTDYVKCAEAWKTATKFLKEYYGDLFPASIPDGAPLSYGHLVSIGAPITIPEDGEPNVSPFASSIDEAIEILRERKGKDFSDNPLFRHYMDMCKYFQEAFSENRFYFRGFGAEGPITSVVLMRGQDFLYDIYDEPEKSKEFLYLITDSVIDYVKFCRRINGEPEISNYGGICDDFSSLIPPDMWEEFVIPYWNQEYEGLSNGTYRYMHVENLTPKHLKHLIKSKLTHYQPSVSDALTIENIKANLDPTIPFDWMLYSYRIIYMTEEEIEKWVDSTVESGVQTIRSQMNAYTYLEKKLNKSHEYFGAFEKYKHI